MNSSTTLDQVPHRTHHHMSHQDGTVWVAEHDEAEIRNYLGVVSAHKWLILGVSSVLAAVAAVVALSLPYEYRGTATLFIESEEKQVVSIQGINGSVNLTDEYLETQNQILQSRNLAEQVIRELNLLEHPEFDPIMQSTGVSFNPVDWFADFLGEEALSEQDRRNEALDSYFERLRVSPVPNSQLIRISFDAHDPALSSQVPNTLVDLYIQNMLDTRLSSTQQAANWMSERLDGLRVKMEESELALQAYRDQERLVDVGGVASIVANELEEITGRLVEARRNEAEAQTLMDQVANADGNYESIPAVLADPGTRVAREAKAIAQNRISELRERYGPMHPSMVEAQSELATIEQNLSSQIFNVVSSLRRQHEVASARVAQLNNDLDIARGGVADINRKQARLTFLEREVDNNRQLYETFVTRLKETSATDDMQSAGARLVDPSTVPSNPIGPEKTMMVMMTFMGSLVSMCFVAFLLETLDNTVKSSSDVERKLSLPVLGILPKLNERLFGGKLQALNHYASNKESAFAENIRTVRTNVLCPDMLPLPDHVQTENQLLLDVDRAGKVILVTSSIRAEGKSTVATNLARSLAQMGKAVLIDADLRNPVITKALKLKRSQLVGLSNYLSGEQTLENCIHHCSKEYMVVMPAGDASNDPLEMLSSERFKHLLSTLKQHFDYIVIDSAPVVPVSDAVVLSRYADGVLYVVKANDTPYQVAQEGIKRLRSADAPLVGAVLNQITTTKKPERYGGYHNTDYYSIHGYSS